MITECIEQKMTDNKSLVEVEVIELQAADFDNCCRIVQFKG